MEGAEQGRLSYSGLGALRGQINLSLPGNYDWNRFGASGAISHLTRLVSRRMEIPVPKEPKTKMVFGEIHSGSSLTLHLEAEIFSMKFLVKGMKW